MNLDSGGLSLAVQRHVTPSQVCGCIERARCCWKEFPQAEKPKECSAGYRPQHEPVPIGRGKEDPSNSPQCMSCDGKSDPRGGITSLQSGPADACLHSFEEGEGGLIPGIREAQRDLGIAQGGQVGLASLGARPCSAR